jgi:hypothetical protein
MCCAGWEAWAVVKIYCFMLRWKSEADSSSKVQAVLFVGKKMERWHGVMKQNLETGRPLDQVGSLVL